MNIEKLLEWGSEYFSDYFSVFISTLLKPTTRFKPVIERSEERDLVLPRRIVNSYLGPNLNPRLFGFMVISILIGATLNSIIPGRPPAADLLTTSVITIAVWVGYSISIFLLCKIIGGKGTFLETMSVSLQLLAVVYVVSNFIIFIWGSVARISFVHHLLKDSYVGLVVEQPVFLYYPVQFILVLFYLPIALKHMHRFGIARLLVIGIIPTVWILWAVISFWGSFVEPLIPTPVWIPLPTPTASSTPMPTATQVWIPLPTPTASTIPMPTATQVWIALPTPTRAP